MLKLDRNEKLLQEDKESLENLLKSTFLNEEEKKFIAKDFWENTQKIKKERNKILSSIITELKNKDPFGTKKNKTNIKNYT